MQLTSEIACYINNCIRIFVNLICINRTPVYYKHKLEKKYATTLDNYGQSCFVKSDLKKMKCVCKTQMMPPPDHKKL